MSEYCEYMWDPTRGRVTNTALARSIYSEEAKFDVRDRKLAIKTVRAILREMPGVGELTCRLYSIVVNIIDERSIDFTKKTHKYFW